MTDMQPGHRQTVDRALHPTLGEGIAVYENGPAFFQSDAGQVERMAKIGLGGSGSNGSYLVARTTGGDRIELKTTKRQRGDHHCRRWSPIFGDGWLVLESTPHGERLGYMPARFDADSGTVVRFKVTVMHVNRPAFYKANAKKKKPMLDPEEEQWTTYVSKDGETLIFRNTAPPEAPAAPPAETSQTSLFP